MRRDAEEPHVTGPPAWDDRMWQDLWDRTLGQVERHRMVMMLWRREEPDDALARRVLPELARRWRGQALVYAVVWGLFAAFWLMVGVTDLGIPRETRTLVPWVCAAAGSVVVAACLWARWWFGPTARR